MLLKLQANTHTRKERWRGLARRSVEFEACVVLLNFLRAHCPWKSAECMHVSNNMRSRLSSSAVRAIRAGISAKFLSSRTLTSSSYSRRYALVGVEYERACSSLLKDAFARHWFCPHGLLTSPRLISSSPVTLHQEIGMPSLSPTMTQGNIFKWRKKEGDQVAPGDVLCEIETDKATLEMEVMEDGFLAKILCPDGSKDIPVGQAIAVVVESEEEVGNFKDYSASSGASSEGPSPPPKVEKASEQDASKTSSDISPQAEASKPTAADSEDRIFASPVARKMAEENKVPLSSLQGTGPDGRIIKSDIEKYLKSASPSSTPSRSAEKPLQSLDYTDIPNTQIRKITAQRLLQSKQTIPHYYLTVDARVDILLSLRSKLNSMQEASGGKRISINDFVLKAAAMALKKVPECNSSWTYDFIRQYHNINISVAVQTDFGLLVPVVQNADQKGLAAIAEDVKTLAEKAKKNILKPVDYEGGTFTVSNLGGPFGVKQFCAIINPPQACILAVGTIDKRVVNDLEGGFSTASFMSVTLSCDHRVVDGAIGARWLGAFKSYIEDPATLLL